MTTPAHISAAPYINRERFRVGMLPYSTDVDAIRQAWQHMRMYGRNRQIASYIGGPFEAFNGNLASVFYPITAFPIVSPTNEAHVGGALICYQHDCSGTPKTVTLSWYDSPAAGSPQKTWTGTINYTRDQDPIELPSGGLYELGYRSVTPSASNDGFAVHKLVATNLLVAGFGLWTLPEPALTDAKNLGISKDNFVTGEAFRGYDTTAGTSLGSLMHSLHHESTSNLSAWHYSRRCLFQTPYPTGVWAENEGEINEVAFGHMRTALSAAVPVGYRIVPRNLRRLTANIRTQPALVVTASGAGVDLRLRSSTTGDTWVWSSSGVHTTELITPSDGTSSDTGALAVDPDIDYIYLESRLDAGTSVLVHTVSLWEWPTYDEESTV